MVFKYFLKSALCPYCFSNANRIVFDQYNIIVKHSNFRNQTFEHLLIFIIVERNNYFFFIDGFHSDYEFFYNNYI